MHEKAIHGFRIVEMLKGQRIERFPHKTAKRYSIARARIVDLARDLRMKHLGNRVFEIWDGLTAVSIITISDVEIVDRPYLLPTEKYLLDADRYYSIRNRIKKQNVGRVRGDITSWIKQDAIDPVLCRKILPESQELSCRTKSRSLARSEVAPGRLKECFIPGEVKSKEWLVQHNLINPENSR
jgi:hypothetical protein